MPRRTNNKNGVGAWSYSAWSVFNKCPAQYQYKYLMKLPTEPPGPAVERGIAIHAKGEGYLLGTVKGVPKEYKHYAQELRQLKKLGAEPEGDIAVTADWDPTTWNDWNGVWCRAKADAISIPEDGLLVVDDWKTGRKYPSHLDQGHLYGTLAYSHYEGVEKVKVRFFYLDKPPEEEPPLELEYPRKDLKVMRAKWEERYKEMATTHTFKPTPGNYCRFCDFSKRKGGPCKKG